MLRRCLAILALVLTAGSAHAQDPQPKNPAIEAVIGDQLDAFEAQDIDRAFSHASPTIKGLFGSPEVFGLMVQRGYPMVWAPGEVTYLELAEIGGALWQRVEIIDTTGQRHYLGYRMEPGESGWKIGAVQILEAPDIAV